MIDFPLTMSSQKELHVTVLTNAIVDILAHVENRFLDDQGIKRGGYRIVSQQEMEVLYSKIPPAIEQSGGSLANTVATLSLLGGRTCCLAKVSNDAFGRIFAHDMKASGVHFPMPPAQSQSATGRSLILIDEQGDRSMNTDLGSSIEISTDDLCLESIKKTHILCVEGYFWSHESPKQAVYQAIDIAKQANTLVAFGLSAEWCVQKFRTEFLELIEKSVDILFGNELEYAALFDMPFEVALKILQSMGVLAVITRGNKGSVIVNRNEILYISSVPPRQFVDATGAGDAYASGFLYGLTHGLSLEKSAELGSQVASLTVSQIGARPEPMAIRNMMKEVGLKIE